MSASTSAPRDSTAGGKARELSAREAAEEHFRAFNAKDLTALVDGYAEDAVILSSNPTVGKAAIAAALTAFLASPAGRAQPEIVIDSVVERGEFAQATYHTAEMQGANAFVVRHGKIVTQSSFTVRRET